MLIEFRVENHRSLRDEQALTFESVWTGDESDTRPRLMARHAERLLPAVAIYGANASGKSNVLAALAFMRKVVVQSHRRWDPAGGVPRDAFSWGGMKDKPSMYEVSFLIDDTKFQYGFCVNDESVEEEWLFAWPKPHSRKQVLFVRDGNRYRFGEDLKGPNEVVKKVTRKNSLFLSTAAQNGHRQLRQVFAWFRRVASTNFPSFRTKRSSKDCAIGQSVALSDEVLATHYLQLLRIADVGIVGVKRDAIETEYRGSTLRRSRLRFQHRTGDEESWLNWEDESEGTQSLLRMAPKLVRSLEVGGLLLIDDLESSLHPLIGLAIVRLFQCPRSNPQHAQLAFSTNDTRFLGASLDEPPLRRDQIWFTEKDKSGATTLYPLTEFKPRKVENLERGYLQGRYGAIPILGDMSWVSD